MCSVCSVVKKNGICSSLKDGTGNADVPRAALRFALGYLILPLWGGDTTTPSCGDCPRFLATEWNNRGQPETPARRSRRIISVRRFEFFQPIAVLAAARYCGAATTYSLLSPKISKAASRKVPKRVHLHHAQWDRKNSAISRFPTCPAVVFSTRSTSSWSLAFKFSLLISKKINAASKPTRLFPSTNG